MGEWLERRGMQRPRHDLAAVAVENRIFAISGADDLTVHDVEMYEVASQTWFPAPPIPTARGWLATKEASGNSAGPMTVHPRRASSASESQSSFHGWPECART